eukprot:scaffold56534_cov60-Phaeocystis_antarctica.AAC.3
MGGGAAAADIYVSGARQPKRIPGPDGCRLQRAMSDFVHNNMFLGQAPGPATVRVSHRRPGAGK